MIYFSIFSYFNVDPLVFPHFKKNEIFINYGDSNLRVQFLLIDDFYNKP